MTWTCSYLFPFLKEAMFVFPVLAMFLTVEARLMTVSRTISSSLYCYWRWQQALALGAHGKGGAVHRLQVPEWWLESQVRLCRALASCYSSEPTIATNKWLKFWVLWCVGLEHMSSNFFCIYATTITSWYVGSWIFTYVDRLLTSWKKS